jgi:hypothetical protein
MAMMTTATPAMANMDALTPDRWRFNVAVPVVARSELAESRVLSSHYRLDTGKE